MDYYTVQTTSHSIQISPSQVLLHQIRYTLELPIRYSTPNIFCLLLQPLSNLPAFHHFTIHTSRVSILAFVTSLQFFLNRCVFRMSPSTPPSAVHHCSMTEFQVVALNPFPQYLLMEFRCKRNVHTSRFAIVTARSPKLLIHDINRSTAHFAIHAELRFCMRTPPPIRNH